MKRWKTVETRVSWSRRQASIFNQTESQFSPTSNECESLMSIFFPILLLLLRFEFERGEAHTYRDYLLCLHVQLKLVHTFKNCNVFQFHARVHVTTQLPNNTRDRKHAPKKLSMYVYPWAKKYGHVTKTSIQRVDLSSDHLTSTSKTCFNFTTLTLISDFTDGCLPNHAW